MSLSLFPDDYISSVYDVDFSALFLSGYRVVLFDVDNTLVPHNAPADDRAKKLFLHLHSLGFKTYMISNNKEPRVKSFCEAVHGSGYEFLAKKPKSDSYLKAIQRAECSPNQAIFFGDQVFTDTLGAKNAGITSIMVRPVKKWHEEPQIVLKRFLEGIVMFFYSIRVKAKGPIFRIPLQEEV